MLEQILNPAIYPIILQAFWKTLVMVFWSTLFSVILGFIPAVILTLTAPGGLKPNKIVYGILRFIVNVFRSFPFIILLVILIPFTRALVGKSIGTTAAIVPLTVSAIPFIARVFETSLRETNPGIVLLVISLVGYSAMAGTVGGGGVGDIAIRYGYQQYKTEYLIVCSLILIIFVQAVQALGNLMYKKMS